MIKDKVNVDNLTIFTANKALESEQEEDIMKAALVHAILRGYNVRSITGACFSLEMSLRWILAQKDLPQFNKMPGTYLDIESSILGDETHTSVPKAISGLLTNQVNDYCIANKSVNDSEIIIRKDAVFDTPKQQKNNDFIIYLMDTRRYCDEDLETLISCEAAQEVFNIAAKSGDVSFFEKLKNKYENDKSFADHFDKSVQKINRGEVLDKAIEYGVIVFKAALGVIKPLSIIKNSDQNTLNLTADGNDQDRFV